MILNALTLRAVILRAPIKKLICFFLIFCFPLTVIAATLTASVDRAVVSEDESFNLTVRIDKQIGSGGPDFSQLAESFDVYNNQRSNQFRSINGQAEGWTQWNLTLAPKKTGTLLIPSFNIDDAYSDAIEVTVKGYDNSANPAESRDIFATVEVNKKSVYVQEQLLVSVKVYFSVPLRDLSPTGDFTFDNAIVTKLDENNYQKRIGERPFGIKELTFAVYPQQSGELKIPELNWVAVVASNNGFRNDPFSSPRGTMRRISSDAISIPVNSRPASYTGANWLPTEKLEIEQHWSTDPSRFVVGEPITRNITLSTQGLSSSQLPPLPTANVDNIKIYTDQPQFDDIKDKTGITGSRIESFAIVPSVAGKMTLPAITIDWWDTTSNQQRSTSLPAQTISVAPAVITAPVTPAVLNPLNGEQSNGSALSGGGLLGNSLGKGLANLNFLWLIISNLIVAALALIFLVAWLRARNAKANASTAIEFQSADPKINDAFHRLRRACSDDDPHNARKLLGEWGQLYWRLPHTASLQEIAARCGSPAVAKELEQLDKILYGAETNSGKWHGKVLWKALVDFKQSDQSGQKKSADYLPPLYPN